MARVALLLLTYATLNSGEPSAHFLRAKAEFEDKRARSSAKRAPRPWKFRAPAGETVEPSAYANFTAPTEAYDWAAALGRMSAHRREDVARYENGSAASAIVAALKDRTHAVWIFRGRVFVHRAYLGEMKRELHLRFLTSVLRNHPSAKKEIGNTVYAFDEGASGPSRCDGSLPALAIAKKRGDGQCGVLVPNPYFGDVYKTWESERKGLVALGQRRAWENRKPHLFWRGKIRGADHAMRSARDCERDAGNYARLQACSLTHENRGLFDVRTTSCEPRMVRFNKRDVCETLLPQTALLREVRGGHCRSISGDFVNHGKFNTYQFLLDLPGSTSGSYSRNLNHLWLLGSVVVFWKGPFIKPGGALQWYSPALEDARTHVAVGLGDAAATLTRVASDDAWRRDLLANARGVADNVLCAKCLANYARDVLVDLKAAVPDLDRALNVDRYARADKKAKVAVVAPDLAALLTAGRCEKGALDLVEVTSGKPRGRGRGTKAPGWSVTTKGVASGKKACDLLAALAKDAG